jgi:hypothetical protein
MEKAALGAKTIAWNQRHDNVLRKSDYRENMLIGDGHRESRRQMKKKELETHVL